ncbi:uncharacterized protein [Medicago truncatula]|uniref:uncharacterized protein n=1 Tax=Medicago truncatula TaxID=3880 RepID=UPI001968953A|nr:uncharacterized protein LOC112418503 [Medicago truncatula]
MCVRLLAGKSNWNVPEECAEYYTKMMRDSTPVPENLPLSYYEAKQLVMKLGLEEKKIDCCVNGCMLFYDNEFGKNDGALEECKFCNSPRYGVSGDDVDRKKKRVAVESMFYLPIIPRLKRLFASMHTVGHMTWHYYNKIDSEVMRHPCDGVAWQHFDKVHPDFANDPRNVRLGLCSDGFTAYNTASARPYSCWPIIVTPDNLPPEMCMTKPYMFLSCIVQGPSNPTDGIDVFLEPLVDDLRRLWVGEVTYDIAKKENFTLRAALMWTINDFPAYGMLSGWSTHGRLACPHCMKDTKAFYLKNGRKNSWFDCHRCFTPDDHEFRRKRNRFRKDTIEKDGPPPKITSNEIFCRVSALWRFPDVGQRVRYEGYDVEHNWTKRSIFWDLPYWKDNLLRHNMDVMHIEKNFCDNIVNTVMNVSGKTKDNEKARMDLPEYCKRPDMELKLLPNGKYLKPKVVYSLTSAEAKSVCQWLKELRMPDEYSSNLSRCADVENGRLRGMKSHDDHVFLERLLPIVFSSFPKHVINPLTEISQFFRDLCASTLRKDELIKMDHNIPIILCKLEQVFPPGFFDSMEHLVVHLAYEAWLSGPVQYRWMYPFERFMGYSKRMVKNNSRVEGSIVAACCAREALNFCSRCLNHLMLTPISVRNEVIAENEWSPSTLSIFRLLGSPSGSGKEYWMNDAELQSAEVHVLINCHEVGPYLHYFQVLNVGEIYTSFLRWFKDQVLNVEPNMHIVTSSFFF